MCLTASRWEEKIVASCGASPRFKLRNPTTDTSCERIAAAKCRDIHTCLTLAAVATVFSRLENRRF